MAPGARALFRRARDGGREGVLRGGRHRIDAGVMAYGDTREAAIAAVRALALRVAADCIDHGEDVPTPLARAARGEDISRYFTNRFTVARPVRRVKVRLSAPERSRINRSNNKAQ